MPTLIKLKKKVRKLGFIDEMEKLGFFLGPDDFWFYRRRGDYLDVICFWDSSSRNWLTVPILCLKFDLIDHCDMSMFPEGFILKMPLFTDGFINEEGVEIEQAAAEVNPELSSQLREQVEAKHADKKKFLLKGLKMSIIEEGIHMKQRDHRRYKRLEEKYGESRDWSIKRLS